MQDTLFERSAQPRADVDEHLCAGKAAGGARSKDTSPVETSAQETSAKKTSTIEDGIAETLSELDAEDSGTFDLGAVPLDEPDAPRQLLSAQRSSASRAGRRRRRRYVRDSANRMLLALMLVSALLALVMVSVAYTEGFIP
jgi:hypothetical protein